MAIFTPKPWVNPFGKKSIFPLFELLVFIAQKGVFSFQNILKDIFLAYIATKKKFQKWPFLDENDGLTPSEKSQFFDFLNFLFLSPRKAFFFRSRMSQTTFSWSILRQKKKLEKWPFLDQNHGLTLLEKCQFFDFFNFLFLQPRKVFFRSRILQNTFSQSILRKKKKLEKWSFWTKTMG